MNLFLIAIIALGLNFCATIYLQVWHDNSTDLSSKKLSKSLNIFKNPNVAIIMSTKFNPVV